MADQDTEQDDRTEEPTARKLEQAIQKGDVAKSQEITTFFVLGGFTLAALLTSGWSAQTILQGVTGFFANAHQVTDGAGHLAVGRDAIATVLIALAAPFAIFIVAGLVGGGLQHRPLWTVEPLTPKLDRISPIAGFKRVFGMEAFVNFAKGLLKLAIIGTLVAILLWNERARIDTLVQESPTLLFVEVKDLSVKLLGGTLALFFFVAIGDALYQRFAWLKRQRMTRREIKEEFKQTEGSPEVKARQRQLRMERARRRMMAAVPEATVVITNPTHYAVALKYEKGMPAPICLAKGVDALALKIREKAREHDVPIIENPPLARALHATVEIDREIPVEHYAAVAEVIGYVLRLRRRRA
ncbi:flagellar biosynthesis protein FlhB [Salinarimonas ramus]|uniref:Flagellar biosynthetic protein FlhB n=1 Tax=Salinarimonas ramus TaxID=690164 RepID=A0A917Q9L4_9HYPH|nr:flagellar biosynthesis protein FlhB [Salinarimonas ramus]GGK37279.1 flagellar biosynthesis protein FlhB [Salinarimonas ramus]